MNYTNDFKEYAMTQFGVTSYEFNNWEILQNALYNPTVLSTFQGANASLTPYILEEREMRVTQMDIFSRLMMDRIIWLAGPVNDRMSTVVQAQLMFLDNLEVKDITLHVDTPGGSVKSGLSIVDVMNYIKSDIITVNTGMAASMGSILLGAGTKGKRYSLPNSRVMLHQVSSGASGNIQDIRRSMAESEKYNTKLFTLLGEYTNKTAETVLEDANRDLWLDAEEALAYGIIDAVITKKKK
jgi:ATP-dependent Clp protease protease subunit|tara:strand:- start:13421 stop:14140 length:720 start_codon:yes stop_codon:yes gene_type:complete